MRSTCAFMYGSFGKRSKSDPERPHYILTETGVGYRLRAPD